MRALVTGATGFVGKQLCNSLENPHVLSRDPQRAAKLLPSAKSFAWSTEREAPPAECFEGVDAVFHLAGDSVGQGRWTEAKKDRIRSSRVRGTRNLVAGIAKLGKKPRVLVCASAVGIYGSRGEEILDESAKPGADYLAEVCQAWEAESRGAEEVGVRVVNLRFGIVLGENGGALSKMLTPFKLGAGGRLGSGAQWMPWVQIEDVVGLALHAAKNESLRGPINVVAPGIVRNLDFTKTLGKVLHRPTIFPMPAFAMRILFGEFSEVLLGSQRVVPKAALASGYAFRHTDLEAALRDSI